MNTLIINAQPDYKNDAHYSIQLMVIIPHVQITSSGVQSTLSALESI